MECSFSGLTTWFWSSNPTDTKSSGTTIYQPLNKTECEIRICDLVPSSKLPAPLRCSLRTVPIGQAGTFVAMSYVWGRAFSTDSIFIDGVKHPIRSNLAAGLRQLRARFSGPQKFISVWADAICIDQSSIDERNHQVPLMRSIFSECESVFAWLGESDESSDLAMDCIVEMDRLCQTGKVGSASFLWMLVQDKYFWVPGPWLAITELLNREFWFRVWIYQEIILPKSVLIACGTKVLPWHVFRALNGMRIFRGGSEHSRKLVRKHFAHLGSDVHNSIANFCTTLHPIFDHKANFDSGQRLTLSELLAETIHLRSTDPRDKIYGLLALDQTSMIIPNYSKTVQDVYTEFAIKTLLENPAYLRFSGLSVRKSDPALKDFPSWVPHGETMSQTTTATALQQHEVFEFIHPRRTKLSFDWSMGKRLLEIDGEISSKVIWAQEYLNVLEKHTFKTLIAKVLGTEYKTTIDYPTTPIQRMVALCCTFVHSLLRKNSREDMDLAAGFCYTVCERLNTTSDLITSGMKAEIQNPFGDYFEWIPWRESFQYAERFQKDYLLREKESLQGKILFETKDGYFGSAPTGIKAGDFLCQLYGYHDPVVLRQDGAHYVLIGSCWTLDYTDHYNRPMPAPFTFKIW